MGFTAEGIPPPLEVAPRRMERDRALKTLQTYNVHGAAKEDSACAVCDWKITVNAIQQGQKPLVRICGTNTVVFDRTALPYRISTGCRFQNWMARF